MLEWSHGHVLITSTDRVNLSYFQSLTITNMIYYHLPWQCLWMQICVTYFPCYLFSMVFYFHFLNEMVSFDELISYVNITYQHFSVHVMLLISCKGEGNGNPLQYFCLENPMNRGAWWTIVHKVQRVRQDLNKPPPPP